MMGVQEAPARLFYDFDLDAHRLFLTDAVATGSADLTADATDLPRTGQHDFHWFGFLIQTQQ